MKNVIFRGRSALLAVQYTRSTISPLLAVQYTLSTISALLAVQYTLSTISALLAVQYTLSTIRAILHERKCQGARQIPGYNSPRRGTARTVPIYFCVVLCIFLCCAKYCLFFCRSVYCLCVNVYCTAATGCQPNCS
jgi:hypothetical protein